MGSGKVHQVGTCLARVTRCESSACLAVAILGDGGEITLDTPAELSETDGPLRGLPFTTDLGSLLRFATHGASNEMSSEDRGKYDNIVQIELGPDVFLWDRRSRGLINI